MTSVHKRRAGTCIAVCSLLMAIATGSIWWRSLFAADLAQHCAPITLDGQYARRNWLLMSGGGFFEIGRTTDVQTTPENAIRINALDQPTGYCWTCAFPAEDMEGSRWQIFVGGLKRLSYYPAIEKRAWLVTSGHYLEVPCVLPFFVFLIAPVVAIVRRRIRIRLNRTGFTPTFMKG